MVSVMRESNTISSTRPRDWIQDSNQRFEHIIAIISYIHTQSSTVYHTVHGTSVRHKIWNSSFGFNLNLSGAFP